MSTEPEYNHRMFMHEFFDVVTLGSKLSGIFSDAWVTSGHGLQGLCLGLTLAELKLGEEDLRALSQSILEDTRLIMPRYTDDTAQRADEIKRASGDPYGTWSDNHYAFQAVEERYGDLRKRQIQTRNLSFVLDNLLTIPRTECPEDSADALLQRAVERNSASEGMRAVKRALSGRDFDKAQIYLTTIIAQCNPEDIPANADVKQFERAERERDYLCAQSLLAHFSDYMAKASEIIAAISTDALSQAGVNPEMYAGKPENRILSATFDGLYIDRVIPTDVVGRTIERAYHVDGKYRIGFEGDSRMDITHGKRYMNTETGDTRVWAPKDGVIANHELFASLRGKPVVSALRTLDDARGATPDIVDLVVEGGNGIRVALVQERGNEFNSRIGVGLYTSIAPKGEVVERYAA